MRVLIADERPKVRFALCILLEQQPDICVAAQVARPQDVVTKTRETSPDVVLLSWDLAGSETGDLIAALRILCPYLQIVVLSGRPEVQNDALQAGADAFVSKTKPPEHLLAAIQSCSHSLRAAPADRTVSKPQDETLSCISGHLPKEEKT